MFASNMYLSVQDVVLEKSNTARDLYDRLLDELKKLGPVCETKKAITISFSSENDRAFAWVIIRNRSIKLVFRIHHRISNPRITSVNRVGDKSYDHTTLVVSKSDIDEELMKWLGEAYRASSGILV